jgi:GxxExxY protein
VNSYAASICNDIKPATKKMITVISRYTETVYYLFEIIDVMSIFNTPGSRTSPPLYWFLVDNIENMKKQQPDNPLSVAGYYIDQWVNMDVVARAPYVLQSGGPDPYPHAPIPPLPPAPPVTPNPDKGFSAFSSDKTVLSVVRRKQCGDEYLKKLWEEVGVVGRRGWVLYEGTLKKSAKVTSVPPSPSAEQILSLYPIRKYLASLRITAFFRVQSQMMLDVQRCAREVYREMGWGWNEKAYQEAIKIELDLIGYRVTSEIPHTIYYKGQPMGDGVNVRSDILVEHRTSKKQLLLELKAVPASKTAMDKAVQQCRRYLRLKSYPAGMVLNFPQQCGERVRIMKILS